MDCPICRRPIDTRVKALPVNFAVQDMIGDLLASSKGMCRSCLKCRKLERASVRCEDCREALCDDCVNQHVYKNHRLESLVEQQCDKHKRALEMYCFRCDANICVTCLLDHHQGHKCHSISKVAEKHTKILERDIAELSSRETRAKEVLRVVLRQKEKYERYFWNMDERGKAETRGRRFHATLEKLKSEERREVVEGCIRAKLKALNAINERNSSGKHTDLGQGRHLLQDVGSVLHVVIVDLGDQAGLLQRFLDGVPELKTKTGDVLRSCLSSVYDATMMTSIVDTLREQIVALLKHVPAEDDRHLAFYGNGKLTVTHCIYVHSMRANV